MEDMEILKEREKEIMRDKRNGEEINEHEKAIQKYIRIFRELKCLKCVCI